MIRKIIKRILYGYKASSEAYIAHMKSVGVRCGENIRIFLPHQTTIDLLNPHLLEIGSNVMITGPVTILTHDYSVFVANQLGKGRLYGKQQPVLIGNNVFLGWGGLILPGSTIGDNVIIGANAVVSGKVESNSVYAGNPAKRICSINEYIEKRGRKQLEEAVVLFNKYYERFEQIPEKSLFHEYFYLFTSSNQLTDLYKEKMKENGNYGECMSFLSENKPMFDSYESFCEFAIQKQ